MPILTNFFPGQETMTVIAMGNVLFVIGLPLLAVILLIVRVVFGRRIGKPWSVAMIVFWFLNVFSLISIGGTLAQEFMVEGRIEESLSTETFAAETVELSYYDWDGTRETRVFVIGEEVELPGARTRFNVRKSKDAEWHVNKIVDARGKRAADARDLAAALPLEVRTDVGRLSMPREIPFEELSKWRAQEAKLEVLVPVGAYVRFGERVFRRGNMRVDQSPTDVQLYRMDETGRLICQDCPAEMSEAVDETDEPSEAAPAAGESTAAYSDYQSISLRGNMKVTVERGDAYGYRMTGDEAGLAQVEATVTNGTLAVNNNGDAGNLRLYLTVPNLQTVDLVGTDDVLIKGFDTETLAVHADGDFILKTTVDVKELNLTARGGVEVEFTGQAERVNAHLEAGSRLDTDRGNVKQAAITAAGGSKVKLGAGTEVTAQEISEDSSLRFEN